LLLIIRPRKTARAEWFACLVPDSKAIRTNQRDFVIAHERGDMWKCSVRRPNPLGLSVGINPEEQVGIGHIDRAALGHPYISQSTVRPWIGPKIACLSARSKPSKQWHFSARGRSSDTDNVALACCVHGNVCGRAVTLRLLDRVAPDQFTCRRHFLRHELARNGARKNSIVLVINCGCLKERIVPGNGFGYFPEQCS